MDKNTVDSAFGTVLVVLTGIAGFLIAYFFVQPTAADGWYDALCDGEVVSIEAGTACLTDGKVELLEEYK